MTNSLDIRCEATVLIHVRDDAPADWISRVAADDFPYKHLDGSHMTEDEGLLMLCYNALRNGVEDASRLDGWGDLERGTVSLEVIDVEAAI